VIDGISVYQRSVAKEIFHAAKLRAEKRGELKLDWRGALRDLRDKYTSVELQHKVLEWWGD